MAHFNFEKMLNEAIKLDGPLQNGPKFRYERKPMEKKGSESSLGLSPRPKLSENSTKTPKGLSQSKTPGKYSKMPTQKGKTPSKTPNKQSGPDRFIPSRSSQDIDLSHFAIMKEKGENEENDPDWSPSKAPYQNQLNTVLNKGDNPQDTKILSFNNKCPAATGHSNRMKVLYSYSKTTVPKSAARNIPQQPDRILDAPDLLDDYYLNLLDWSTSNILAVALGTAIYLWNATTCTIAQLLNMQSENDYITGLSWTPEGGILAVGTNAGAVQLWDTEAEKLLRVMTGHAARVGALSWNSHIVTSGSRSGAIHHHDVRVPDHHVGSLIEHTQEVCGLTWSPDGRHLASGGNDNIVNVWDTTLALEGVSPVQTFTHHLAAVKALAWCPWNPVILASGGGTADRHIRLWNISNGSCVNAIDTNSQVCSILWSSELKEMISGHGYSQNQLTIWKYPQMNRIAELTGHEARVLSLTMSPCGTTVASAAADETIRLWKCFAKDKEKVKKTAQTKSVKETFSLPSRIR